MKAKDIMSTGHLWAAAEDTTARHVAEMMAQHDTGCIPVLDQEGKLCGIVTDRDLVLRVIAPGLSLSTPVSDFMSREVFSVDPEADQEEIEYLMREHKIRRIPVVDDKERILGFISMADLARRLHGQKEEHELAEVLETVSQPG